MPTTFAVCDVVTSRVPKPPRDWGSSVATILHARVEATSEASGTLVGCTDAHPLALAAHDAFYDHCPLVLSPDAIWFCIGQGFAHHVSLNADRLRHRFVRHKGKEKLVVERSDFFLGRPNPWPEAFAAFSAQVAAHVGRLRDLVVADFSTTGPVERAASEVLVMDSFQPYFEYEMMAGCGIPAITLLGTVDDWRSVRRRAAMLSEFELETWIAALLPILDQFVAAAEGRVDVTFWRSFFRYQSGSGPAELTGWIHVLFPYLRDAGGASQTVCGERGTVATSYTGRVKPNPYIATWEKAFRIAKGRMQLRWNEVQGPSLSAIPSGLASAPVKLEDLSTGSEHALRFVGGLFGVTQDAESLALRPQFGWAVVYDGSG